MSSEEIEKATSEIQNHIVDFLEELDSRMDDPRLGEVVEHNGTLRSANLGQRPERLVEDALIWPILNTLGFEVTPQPYYPAGHESDCPDFRIDNLSDPVIGENKSTNRFGAAEDDIEGYLDSRRYEYGIATDGLRWGVYEIETDDNGRTKLNDIVDQHDLTPAVKRIVHKQDLVSYNEQLNTAESIEGVLGQFYQTYNHYSIRRSIGGLTEFYDLYLEIISGDGEYESLEADLVAAIDALDGASHADRVAFATLLVDRLAFLKLLSDRGVLDNIALHDQWSEHNQGLNRFRGSFYSEYFQPLFYDVLSIPPRNRKDELPGSFGDSPYLSGGLFEPIIPDERAYDIPDHAMKPLLARFIEGEGQTLINEAANGPLLETYKKEFDSSELVVDIPEHYATIVDAYTAEIKHVESDIERTLRSFTESW